MDGDANNGFDDDRYSVDCREDIGDNYGTDGVYRSYYCWTIVFCCGGGR